jgi:aminopeptidase N
MENWGLVTFRETALLYSDEYNSAANKQRVAEVVAHELAHFVSLILKFMFE